VVDNHQEDFAMKRVVNELKPVPTSTSSRSRVVEFPRGNENSQHERVIEARLRELTALVADLTDSGYGILLSQEPSTQEAFDEVRVKEAALRWIVRVAKHSTGTVRKKLWSDIDDAVSGLEKTAWLLLDSRRVWGHIGQMNHNAALVGPGRF
jgi:hypothetical protein